MRLLTFSTKEDPQPIVGALAQDGSVIDFRRCASHVADAARVSLTDMLKLIAAGPIGLDAAAQAIASRRTGHYALDEIAVHAPIPRPRKNIFCIGWNYLAHFEEGAGTRTNVKELPDHVTFFTKTPTTVNGPYAAIPAHKDVTSKLDWEAELAVVS